VSIQKAIGYYHQQQYTRAIELIRSELLLAPTPEKKFWLGKSLLAIALFDEAQTAFLSCLETPALTQSSEINLAIIDAKQDRLFIAETRLRSLLPSTEKIITLNLASVLYQQGRAEESVQLLQQSPLESNSTYWYMLGSAFLDLGSRDKAFSCFEQATVHNPQNSDAWVWMAAIHVDHVRYDEAISCLQKILSYHALHPFAHFQLAALFQIIDRPEDSIQHSTKLSFERYESWISSWNFSQEHGSAQTKLCGTTEGGFHLLPERIEGLCIELGVRFGNSLQRLQRHTQAQWHGFDSFAGLPSSWNERAKGSYSTGGYIPDLGSDITLYKGWFIQSIPTFMQHQKGPISILHIDCDLYSSTKEALFLFAPWITTGTILIFDEYLMNPTWQEDEHKAFLEIAEQKGWTFEYRSFSIFSRQVIVQITQTVSESI
jgi:tetratricopeptide (TPR) repeat protein